jgi:hypothetical protein
MNALCVKYDDWRVFQKINKLSRNFTSLRTGCSFSVETLRHGVKIVLVVI